jgi:hypothetical protein
MAKTARKAKAGKLARSRAMTRGFALAGEPKRAIVAIRVKFELNAKNGLRRIMFGLEKSTQGEVVVWKIDFSLFERDKKTDAYGDPLVSLEVEVDTKLNAKAEATAQKGLTPPQAAHAMGPAADDAKDAQAGNLDEDEAKGTVQATLAKR